MGNGSNLLVSDEGFRGMIIQIGKNFQEISVQDTVIEVQAGALLSRTARAAWNAGLTGFEFAAGIPGTTGGAVAMNAGAYGGEIKDVILDAQVLTQDGEFLTLTAEELELSYRHSCIFEKNYVVVSARFAFEKEMQIRSGEEWMNWPKPEGRSSLWNFRVREALLKDRKDILLES